MNQDAHSNSLHSVAITFVTIITGPPSALKLNYTKSNNSVCLDTYSHPDYPVHYNNISISINDIGTDEQLGCEDGNYTLKNNSQCVFLQSNVCNNITGSCKTLDVVVTARNALGSSELTTEILLTGIKLAANGDPLPGLSHF